MKILQKSEKTLYRFRCSRCKTLFEMDKTERDEADHKYGYRQFECPICNAVRVIYKDEYHAFAVMEDGTEYQKF